MGQVGENGGTAAAASATGAAGDRRRIYVGGLGGSVTENDLQQTFSPLGEVLSVDIVRTKGRSFAYLDFLPSSGKSLARLFSTYNGCLWKGGRLRLENAKEHYLDRLRREWQEDAELANSASKNNADGSQCLDYSEKRKKDSSFDKMQIRIFFPKMKKVKSLPFRGTGKHKYSFQRVVVPPFPVHFCDCEEHSSPIHMGKEKSHALTEAESGGINEEELKIMNSVMEKLLEGDDCSKSVLEEAELSKEDDGAINSIDSLLDGQDELLMTDEDDLMINIVATGKGKEKKMSDQVPDQKALSRQKRELIPQSKKRKSAPSKESAGNKIATLILETKTVSREDQTTKPESDISKTRRNSSQKSAWKDLISQKETNPFRVSDIIPIAGSGKEEEQPQNDDIEDPHAMGVKIRDLRKHDNASRELDRSESREKVYNAKSARGASWLHESSWTQLITSSNDSPFSISQILPPSSNFLTKVQE